MTTKTQADVVTKVYQIFIKATPEAKAEGPTTVTYEIQEAGNGVTKPTLTHELQHAPLTTAQVAGEIEGAGGGWSYVLSDLKSLLETGKALEVGDSRQG